MLNSTLGLIIVRHWLLSTVCVIGIRTQIMYCIHEEISWMLASLHWLPSHFRIKFKFLLFNFKFQLTHPTPLSAYTSYAPTHSLCSADHLLLSVWKRQGNLRGDQALAVAAPKLWNLLPQHIRQASSLSDYKSFLKIHLSSLAFDTYWNVDSILFEMQF